MTPLAGAAASLPAAIVLAHGAWWTALSFVALRRPRPLPASLTPYRFAVIVPAHNEAAGIAACVASLRAAPFAPAPGIVVVADNCDDDTAARARAAGATVLERTSPDRGKSYALDFAIDHLRAHATPPDAVVVVDADTLVDANLFAAIASSLDRGAEAVQVHYAADDAPGTLPALRRLALALAHWSRPLGASRLGLGGGLKGNGMAFRWHVVRDGMAGAGLTEDAAATLDLARRGVAVRFAPATTVRGQMARTYAAAATQDRRWEGGRLALIPRALAAAIHALRHGHIAAAAGALEVATLPLSLLGVLTVVSFAAVPAGASLPLAVAALVSLVTYVAAGLAAARVRRSDLLALRAAPRFVAHKLGVFAGLLRRRQSTWDRTTRT